MLYNVVMHIVENKSGNQSKKIYHSTLLRESYRENGKVKKRTIANLSHCKPEEITAIKLALKHRDNLSVLGSLRDSVKLQEGLSVGAVWTVYQVARELGIEQVLGNSFAGKLALWQVMARVIEQGSCLSAVRLAQTHAACDVLGMRRGFDENDLYENLAWLAENQVSIEKQLFTVRRKGGKAELFLYDVTSSYFEGVCNELADWGYNRDKKSGKKQVVVGLLCDEYGEPTSLQLFTGNTRDFDTFGEQVKKAAEVFGCHRVTFVGDRGMIKSGQIKDLKEVGFYYITAITKPQIGALIKDGILQMELFDEKVCEVEHEGVRYILRRNPRRAEDMARIRGSKRISVEKLVQKKNVYLAEHPRATMKRALKEVNAKIERLKVEGWLRVKGEGRRLQLQEDGRALAEESRLDGCYVIKSDLPKDAADTQTIHDRYKDLTKVEQAFRTCKTALLEMRPWYVWTEKSTRGHALVVMLAYLVARQLQRAWVGLDVTVEEGLRQLSTLCSMQVIVKEQGTCHHIPTPRQTSVELLKAADIRLPKVLPHLGARVVTRKKLASHRRVP